MNNRRDTTDGKPPAPGHEVLGAPQPIDPKTGMHGAYWVLSAEERAKGFVRPVRRTYVHTGERPTYPLRVLTDEERARHAAFGYAMYEAYPEDSAALGRFWTAKDLTSGCHGITTMGIAIAETYAREPGFYGSTFCCRCGVHLPVSQFTWDGTAERVGS